MRTLVTRHLDENGRLPSYRAIAYRPGEVQPAEYYGYDDEEFERFCDEERRRVGELTVIEAGTIMTTNEADENTHRIVKAELTECRILEEVVRKLKAMGVETDDYYAERVEQVDGTLPAARFLLAREGEEPVELDNLAALVEAIRSLGSRGTEIKRFKGLGEMNAHELADTTMIPEKRAMLKVVVSDEADDPEQLEIDAREADRIFSILMGDNVEARRQYIEQNALMVKNLDI